MDVSQEFPNLKLEHLKSNQKLGMIVAFGFRTVIILDKYLNIMCKFLDSNKSEKFLCADFFECNFENFCSANSFFLILGGESGIIKVLDLKECKLVTFVKGHTGAIHDIKVIKNYIVSCSEDGTIRVWNLKTLECIVVCGGLAGHKDHVLSIDVSSDLSYILSSGTDCIINQWKLPSNLETEDIIFIHKPFTTFNNVHKCAITKVKYWGNLILSLSNNMITLIYNQTNFDEIKEKFNLNYNDPVYIGSIEFFGICKKFDIKGHTVLGVSTNADVYIFDLKNIINEKAPYIIGNNFNNAEDICILGNSYYISSGNRVHRFDLDPDHFN